MRHGFKRAAGTVTGLLLVASSLFLTGVPPGGGATNSTSTLRCGTDELNVIWRGTTGGLAGTVGELFWIRNQGLSPCVVSGFPTITFYANGKKLPMQTSDVAGHFGNDMMGVASKKRLPTIRLLSNAIASFWIFGNDVMSKCINASQIMTSVKSLTGHALIPVPRGYSAWIFCGGGIAVNPMVPGVSGSDPPRPLHSEIMKWAFSG